MTIESILSAIDSFIWGAPLLILLSGTGLYLTLRLGFIQIRYLPRALGYLFKKIKVEKGTFPLCRTLYCISSNNWNG